MEYILFCIVLSYLSFSIGQCYEAFKNHKKWENEMLPLIKENKKLDALLRLNGIDRDLI